MAFDATATRCRGPPAATGATYGTPSRSARGLRPDAGAASRPHAACSDPTPAPAPKRREERREAAAAARGDARRGSSRSGGAPRCQVGPPVAGGPHSIAARRAQGHLVTRARSALPTRRVAARWRRSAQHGGHHHLGLRHHAQRLGQGVLCGAGCALHVRGAGLERQGAQGRSFPQGAWLRCGNRSASGAASGSFQD